MFGPFGIMFKSLNSVSHPGYFIFGDYYISFPVTMAGTKENQGLHNMQNNTSAQNLHLCEMSCLVPVFHNSVADILTQIDPLH